ncbi:MAG: RNA polymerase sigma factor [Acidobacteria bacterium]|nr:RNA polymerase sigma factor [Acidobacteriota bacterium]
MEDYNQLPDAELLARCLKKDADAWEALVRRYQRLVSSITVRFKLPAADAADILQGVFIALYKQMGSLQKESRLSSWLITVTVRECWKLRQRQGVQETVGEDQWAQIADQEIVPPLDEEFLAYERQHLVRRAFEDLSPQCRQILEQLFYQEVPATYAEISRRIGIPVASIGPTRGRCLEKLREQLRRVGFF